MLVLFLLLLLFKLLLSRFAFHALLLEYSEEDHTQRFSLPFFLKNPPAVGSPFLIKISSLVPTLVRKNIPAEEQNFYYCCYFCCCSNCCYKVLHSTRCCLISPRKTTPNGFHCLFYLNNQAAVGSPFLIKIRSLIPTLVETIPAQ